MNTRHSGQIGTNRFFLQTMKSIKQREIIKRLLTLFTYKMEREEVYNYLVPPLLHKSFNDNCPASLMI